MATNKGQSSNWYKVLASTSDVPGSVKVRRLISVYADGVHIYEETVDGQRQPKRDVTWDEMKSIGYKKNIFKINLRNGRDIFFGTRSTKITGDFYKTCKAGHKKYLHGAAPGSVASGSVGKFKPSDTVSVFSGSVASVTSTETSGGEYIVTPAKPLEKETPMIKRETPVIKQETETPVITAKREEKLISVKDETPTIEEPAVLVKHEEPAVSVKREEPAVSVKEVKVPQTDAKSDSDKYFFAFVVLCVAIFVFYVARSIPIIIH